MTTTETNACNDHPWARDLLDACKFLLGPSSIDEAMDRIREIVESADRRELLGACKALLEPGDIDAGLDRLRDVVERIEQVDHQALALAP